MRGEQVYQNKIITVKSLVENEKQHKKRFVQFTAKDSNPTLGETLNITKHGNVNYHPFNSPFTRPQSHPHPNHSSISEKVKGISTGKHYAAKGYPADVKQPQNANNAYISFEEYYSTVKTDRITHNETKHQGRSLSSLPEGAKYQSADICSQKTRDIDIKDKGSNKLALNQSKESMKVLSLNSSLEQINKDFSRISDNMTGKFEDDTWNISKFQKMSYFDRQSQPIYKNELTKIKTKLFQKQAQLFQKSQQIEHHQKIIVDLTAKLQISNSLNSSLKAKLANLGAGSSNAGQSEEEVQRLSDEILRLNNKLNSRNHQYNRQEENMLTNNKMLHLKLRQYQIDDKEKTQFIYQLKQKQKRNQENYEKIINGQRELLRQKEEQLAKIAQAASFYKQQVSGQIRVIDQLENTYRQQIISKESVIRELSDQISDLRSSLNQLQSRMREMIDNQDQLKRQLEMKNPENGSNKQDSDKADVTELNELRIRLKGMEQQICQLKQINSGLDIKIQQLQDTQKREKQSYKELMSNFQTKQLQIQIISKACEQYNKQMSEYFKYSEQMRIQVEHSKKNQLELKKIITDQSNQIQRYRPRYLDKDERQLISPQKPLSPFKEVKNEEKQVQKTKQINMKLLKENERLNIIIKDLNIKLYQFYKVNKGLNDEIIFQNLAQINSALQKKQSSLE